MAVVDWFNDNQGFSAFLVGVLTAGVAVYAILAARRDTKVAERRADAALERERETAEKSLRAQIGAALSLVPIVGFQGDERGGLFTITAWNTGAGAATGLIVWAETDSGDLNPQSKEPPFIGGRDMVGIAHSHEFTFRLPPEVVVKRGKAPNEYLIPDLTVRLFYDDAVGQQEVTYSTISYS